MNQYDSPPKTIFGVENEYGLSWPGLEKLGSMGSVAGVTNSELIASLFIDYFYHYICRENPFKPNRPLAYFPPSVNHRNFCWTNGSRIYFDVGHPEYATPECQNPLMAALHVKAGEYLFEIVLRDMNRKMSRLSAGEIKKLIKESDQRTWFFQSDLSGLPIEKSYHPEFGKIFIHKNNTDYAYNPKNNTDYVGNSYGTHENYLCLREKIMSSVYYAQLFGKLRLNFVPFLVTRQVFAGAGGFCKTNRDQTWRYVISPKALSVSKLISGGTTHEKPLISTKDRAFAPDVYFRLHLSCGDALMSEFATWLALGTTWLVLSMAQDGWLDGQIVFDCEKKSQNPDEENAALAAQEIISNLKKISDEYSGNPDIKLQVHQKGDLTALEIQKLYLNLAKDYFREARRPEEWEKDIMEKWEFILKLLENNDAEAGAFIEWIAKKNFLEGLAAKKLGLRDERIALNELSGTKYWNKKITTASGRKEELQDILLAAAVQYSDISRKQSLYWRFAKNGLIKRMFSDFMVKQAIRWPPLTRASLREYARNKAKNSGYRIHLNDWSKFYLVGLSSGDPSFTYEIKIPWGGDDLAREALKLDLWFENKN